MRYILVYLLLFLFSISKAYSDIKGQIISNLEKTNNYSFNFVQQINKKKETISIMIYQILLMGMN